MRPQSLSPTGVGLSTSYGAITRPYITTFSNLFRSCLFTTFLCTWTVLHLNIPARHETYWHQIRRKLRWMVQAIMAPEFVLGFATGQKVEAERSVEEFRRAGFPHWTKRHAFYANMGGFVLQPRDWCPFPVNAKQLLYLTRQGYTDYPDLTEEEVWDKSKADGFQKTLTCLQTGWFILQTIGRAIQRLPVTTLELTTLSYVFCSLAMYFQWANKPLDVQSPTIIKCNVTIHQILRDAGHRASRPYRQTPLDFIDDQSPSWLTEVQPYLRFRRGPPERPLPRFTNDRLPVIGAGPEAVVFFVIDMVYCAIHFIGWNFDYPTSIELKLWRASCLTMTSCALVFWICETYQDGHRVGRWRRWHNKIFPTRHRIATMSRYVCSLDCFYTHLLYQSFGSETYLGT